MFGPARDVATTCCVGGIWEYEYVVALSGVIRSLHQSDRVTWVVLAMLLAGGRE